MASGKMAAAAPYLERLAENEYVHERLSEAVQQLQAAYSRASGRSAVKAAQDRRLQHQLGRAMTAAREAAVTVRTGRRPRRRSRWPLVVGAAVAVGGVVAASGPVRRRVTGGGAENG